MEEAFDYLDAPVKKLASVDAPLPYAANLEKLALPRETSIKAPHFIFYVRELLEARFGASALENGGYRVITTLDYPLEVKGEAIAKKYALENAPESQLYDLTLSYFKELNNNDHVGPQSEETYLNTALMDLGYIDDATQKQPNFDPYDFIKQLTNLKLR
jgi:membrane carboxypeptidase/penicillin-binding protein